MAVTVSNQPIKVYLTNPKTNTAHPIGGVLTQEQQETLDTAKQMSADAVLKNSEEVQAVNSKVEFTQPIKIVNTTAEEATPVPDTEAASVRYVNEQVTAVDNTVNTLEQKLEDYPQSGLDIATLSKEQSFIEQKHFDAGLTAANYENVSTAPNNAVLNKQDTETLVESILTEKDGGFTKVHVVADYPEESAMESGHIYVKCNACTIE